MKVVAVLVAFGIISFLRGEPPKNGETVDSKQSQEFDLKLPGETEKQEITADEIQIRLVELSDLPTYSGEYTKLRAADQNRCFLEEIPVAGTTNSISIECRGVVKVGYDVTEIVPEVDHDSHKIYISIPEAEVLDNYVIWDSVTCEEKNNILNPIEFSQYEKLIAEIERDGLEQAEKDGIYQAGEEQFKTLVKGFLADFEEYEIVFL